MKFFLICGCITLGLVLPFYSYAQTSTGTQGSSNLQMLVALQTQLKALQAQLKLLTEGPAIDNQKVGEWKFNYSKSDIKLGVGKEDDSYDEDDAIRRYLVQNNRLYENDQWTKNTDTEEYEMWNIFAKIAGEEFVDEYITRYATFRNADTGLLGFVRLLEEKEPAWGLAVNANATNFSSKKWTRDLVAVLIHEYTHVLTLNGDQVNHNRKHEVACRGNYLSNKGCAEKKAYINAYVAQFWGEEDFSRKTPSKKKYFKEHPDEFVTEYGLKSPEEDIAESFTQFILYEKPTGTQKKDLKVAFFYNYPELVEMRTRIRAEIEEYYQ